MAAKHQQAERGPTSDFGILEELYPQLRRFAAVVADLDVDPDDLVQDALCETLRRHALHELDQPVAYLKRAMVNAAASDRRRKSRWKSLLPRLAGDSRSADHYPSDLSDLEILAPLDRAVLFLVDVERLQHELAAGELGLTPSAVRKRASRARARLRAELGPNLSSVPKEA